MKTETSIKTKASIARTTGLKTVTTRLRTVCATRLLPVLLLLALPVVMQGQSYTNDYGLWFYTTTNGTITITSYLGLIFDVTIPDRIPDMTNGLPVTSIGEAAFNGSLRMTSVTIPDSVTSIGDAAFTGCNSLTNLTIGNGVITIGNSAFSGCSLTSVTIPDSITSFDSAFGDCPKLTNITIGKSVTNIGSFAFSWCISLTSVRIPDSVTSIGEHAFDVCPSLTSVTIGTNVTSIGDDAFWDCTNLTVVYFQGNAPSPGLDMFDLDNYATVYYLPGTTGWGTTFGGRPAVLWNPQVQTSGVSFGVRTNRFGFTVTGSDGMRIVVEACTNLNNSTWSPIQSIILTRDPFYFSDPKWTNYPGRFYRLQP